jgi:hypothetical protein
MDRLQRDEFLDCMNLTSECQRYPAEPVKLSEQDHWTENGDADVDLCVFETCRIVTCNSAIHHLFQ